MTYFHQYELPHISYKIFNFLSQILKINLFSATPSLHRQYYIRALTWEWIMCYKMYFFIIRQYFKYFKGFYIKRTNFSENFPDR